MGAVVLHSLSLLAGPFPRRVWSEAESARRGVCSAATTVEEVERDDDRSIVRRGEAREGSWRKKVLLYGLVRRAKSTQSFLSGFWPLGFLPPGTQRDRREYKSGAQSSCSGCHLHALLSNSR